MKKIKFVVLSFVFFFLCSFSFSNQRKEILFKIENSYRISIVLELKCDWNKDKKVFNYYKIINVPKRNKVFFSLPKDVGNCEIWALNVKLFNN